jgi:hypothetical protein
MCSPHLEHSKYDIFAIADECNKPAYALNTSRPATLRDSAGTAPQAIVVCLRKHSPLMPSDTSRFGATNC